MPGPRPTRAGDAAADQGPAGLHREPLALRHPGLTLPGPPVDPGFVRLERLPVDVVRGLVAGGLARPSAWHPAFPTQETLSAAWLLLSAYDALGLDPHESPWWMFGVVVDGQVVGDAGFHGPPPEEGPVGVEIGYQVVPALRRRGVATRACALLLEHAWCHGAEVVRAEVEPGPYAAASRAVLAANGFRPADGSGFGGVSTWSVSSVPGRSIGGR